ncbi:hypothetical protein [Paenibacillus segetis]|uniref:Lipoprotein n=1 Tax=Paenibacillus segetis TaxID=1325360 RepID=A0ABQ1Y837_9BACL|nr:hypothetical protein [Paenibacillus segetis]GGH15135.1 hypothetical protein GCM10008013_09160 [Paenibacillus segetis]
MTHKSNIQRRFHATLLLFTCLFILLSGCSKAQTESQNSIPPVETPAPTESNTNTTTEQPNSQTESNVADSEGIPADVKVKKVLVDTTIKKDYHKKVELLTDGGKRVTITDPKGEIVLRQLEYDGIIQAVNGNQVTVQVEHGGQQTLTIPSHIVIEDEDNLGLNKGVEIEWTVDTDGQIQSVELDD